MTVYQNMNNENEDTKRYWLYSPGEQAVKWEEFYNEGIMAIGWDKLGDLKNYTDRKSILDALIDNYGGGEDQPNNVSAIDDFCNGENKINIGDIVIAKKGTKTLLGYGCITSNYYYDEDREEFLHCRKVKWLKKGEWQTDDNLVLKVLTNIKNNQKGKKYLDIMNKQENNNIINLLRYKPQIILQGPPGTGKTREAKRIAKALLGLGENDSLEGNEQFKLIQFHPSYSYEDFVRGIVAMPNEEGDGIIYTAENKVLAEFANRAQKSLQECLKRQSKSINWEDFRDFLQKKKEKNKEVYFSDKVKLDRIENYKDGHSALYFLVKKNEDWMPNEAMIHFSNFSQENLDDNFENFYTNYDRGYWESITNYFINWFKQPEPFVLIIDEINRANLSAVLGELIYALEYRGEAVQSMYAIEGENNLILPPNLYIIGTMNTADRSVGHIDYAIRRRFAFVNVLPKELEKDFDRNLFKAVSKLFIDNYDEYINNPDIELKRAKTLSPEFRPEDVWLGHSYFITKNTPIDIRWEYEIKPILLEYVKDGILIGEGIETTINNLINDENNAS